MVVVVVNVRFDRICLPFVCSMHLDTVSLFASLLVLTRNRHPYNNCNLMKQVHFIPYSGT
jgi:hypothetical protein